MDHAWDMLPLHYPLNVDLLNVTHKFHVSLKAHIILMKLAVPRAPREVDAKRYSWSLEQLKSVKAIETSPVAIFEKRRRREREQQGKKKEEEERARRVICIDLYMIC